MEKYRLLLVDDEPAILRSLARLFRDNQVDLLFANSGEEALDIIKDNSVEVLVTDNLMPGMTGVELLRRVKDVSPDTVRIVLSGHSEMEAVLRAVNEGEAFRFVLKPWNDIDLKVTVNLALAHYKLTHDNRQLIRELREKSRLLDKIRQLHPGVVEASLKELSSEDGYEVCRPEPETT